MLTSLPAINSAIASTTRTRSSIESRGQRYGPSPFSARSPSASFSCGSGRPEIADRPTMRGPCGLIGVAAFGRPGPHRGFRLRVWRDGPRGPRQPPAQQQSEADQRRAPEIWAVPPETLEQGAGDDRPQDARQAADRLREAHDLALLL